MTDRGANDFKLLSVPNTDPLFAGYHELEHAPPHFLREVEHFFATYKQLEGIAVETHGWSSRSEAITELESSIRRLQTA
jgi:inorganic pyrophosphatase